MNFLRNNRRFSLIYDGNQIAETDYVVEMNEKDNELVSVYKLKDGLVIKNIAHKIKEFGAYEWFNIIENTSDTPTKIITELFDGDFSLPFEHEEPYKFQAYFPNPKEATKVFAPTGSTWSPDEFTCDVDKIVSNNRINHIYPGNTKKYKTSGGRSSVSQAPFFNINKKDNGVIFAIGWTGQWNCEITRGEDDITIKTKIEDTYFRLQPGEKIRTSSILVMPYKGDVIFSQNQFRRLLKKHFSLIGMPGRDTIGPLCAGLWGGMKSETMLERLKIIKDNEMKFDYIWIDAGWYGEGTLPSPDEFEGDWFSHTGDWRISKKIHPNELVDVSEEIHKMGMKLILWFEPERVIKTTPIAKLHPEYFISDGNPDNISLLLNLGNEEAWNYCFNTISDLIKKLNIDCYRQDFNFGPLEYWRNHDLEDRKGITEIKHINGMYRLWDALLEEFPHLLIDNCAGGGRRIDIETLRRSVPLWRSDYQCPANYDDYAAQCHSLSFNNWIPYSGTGCGRLYDIYRVRSAYGTSLTTNYSQSERESFCETAEKIAFVKNIIEEYKRVRPYFSEDFYPLAEYSDKTDIWYGAQFDRPEKKDGIIHIFRREDAPYSKATYRLHGIDKNGLYEFIDADSNNKCSILGEELIKNGFTIEIPKPRTAKIFFYSYK